jgi:hypothetical protein
VEALGSAKGFFGSLRRSSSTALREERFNASGLPAAAAHTTLLQMKRQIIGIQTPAICFESFELSLVNLVMS